MFYNYTGSASASVVGQSLREERERRAEAEKQVQLLEQRVAGELATCSYSPWSYTHECVHACVCVRTCVYNICRSSN